MTCIHPAAAHCNLHWWCFSSPNQAFTNVHTYKRALVLQLALRGGGGGIYIKVRITDGYCICGNSYTGGRSIMLIYDILVCMSTSVLFPLPCFYFRVACLHAFYSLYFLISPGYIVQHTLTQHINITHMYVPFNMWPFVPPCGVQLSPCVHESLEFLFQLLLMAIGCNNASQPCQHHVILVYASSAQRCCILYIYTQLH